MRCCEWVDEAEPADAAALDGMEGQGSSEGQAVVSSDDGAASSGQPAAGHNTAPELHMPCLGEGAAQLQGASSIDVCRQLVHGSQGLITASLSNCEGSYTPAHSVTTSELQRIVGGPANAVLAAACEVRLWHCVLLQRLA